MEKRFNTGDAESCQNREGGGPSSPIIKRFQAQNYYAICLRWQCLYFFPLPQGQGSFLPTFVQSTFPFPPLEESVAAARCSGSGISPPSVRCGGVSS